MDTLTPAATDIIVDYVLSGTPKSQHHVVAANLRLVGHHQCTTMAQKIWECMEPGCTQKANQAYQQLMGEHLHLQDHFEEEIAKLQKPTCPLSQSSPLADLKKFAKQIHCPVSGTKAVVWDNISAKLKLEQQATEEAIEQLRKKKDHPPVLPRCFLSQDTQNSIKNIQQRRIPASTAKKEYLLNDNELSKLDCALRTNPHYRSAAPMRLYKLTDVEKAAFLKFGNVAGIEAERQKRQNTAQKRRNTFQNKAESFTQRLQQAGVDHHTLVRFAPGLQSLDRRSEPSFERLLAAWNRLLGLRTALAARGCELRTDSRLCCQYIEVGQESVEYVANMMQEMKFFFQETDYANIRQDIVDTVQNEMRFIGERWVDWDETNREASEEAKSKAIKQWLKRHRPEECPYFPRRFFLH